MLYCTISFFAKKIFYFHRDTLQVILQDRPWLPTNVDQGLKDTLMALRGKRVESSRGCTPHLVCDK